ncbi:hypothetical protein [Roseiflexus castenholzii]|uniref:hypothetical protein n=1 Tax=Roseiflexus castenholzii TaxID=120962 RepID=UPI0023531C03
MAAPKATRAPIAWSGALIHLRRWKPGLPLILAAFSVLVALAAAYAAQPFVVIDVGAPFDYPHIRGMHAREFTAQTIVVRAVATPGSNEVVIDKPLHNGVFMATLTLDDWKPDGLHPRRLIAVYANDRRINTLDDRGGDRHFRLLLPEDVDLSGGLRLRIEAIPDRTLNVPPVSLVDAEIARAQTYRWTSERTAITFPALGNGDWRVELQALVAHPDGSPVDARVFANGELIANLPDTPGMRRYQVMAPARALDHGDLTLEITANPYRDPRPLGVSLERVTVTPLSNALSVALPPWSAFVPALTIVLSAYGALRFSRVPAWSACVTAGAVAILGSWALAAHRYPTGLFLEPLAWFMLFTLALTPLMDRGVTWIFRKLDAPLDPGVRAALLIIFLAGLWVKGGGLLFPYMRAIDIGWHMDRVRWILDGHWAEMYLPGAFSESVMPINEWGPNRPVIPYSPFFHLFSTLFALFPWPLETSANLFSALLDNSRVFLIALLARKAGLSNRVTLFAALIYAVTPVTFLLHSWGNVPTTSGMWWTLVTSTVMIALYPRLHERGPFALLTVLTTVTLLFYTVMAVFHVVFVVFFVGLALIAPVGIDRKPLRPIVLSLGAALIAATLIYYGQYIPPILERTVPYVLNLATAGPQSVGVDRPPFSEYMFSFWRHLRYDMRPDGFLYYGLLIPLIFVVPGFLALRKQALLWVMLAAWFSVGTLFMLVGYRVSMVDKQLFYIVPAICLCWGVYAKRFWQRGWWGRVLVITIYAFTLATALDLWIIRIARSPVV